MNAATISFFWGAFFGTVLLMLAGALAAFVQSHHRVALAAALSSLVSGLFVVSYLGWLPIGDPDDEARLLAHIGIFSATMLGLMLLVELGLLRDRDGRRRVLA
ncbi:MAG TPA: GGDEF domain-containing protein, partial [Ramlibacter sp.]